METSHTVIYKYIRELKPYRNNAKQHSKEQIEQIAQSIKQFGFTQPVLIDKENNVIAGHGRILGAKKAGIRYVPTICLSQLTEAEIQAYRLVDNKLNESLWDDTLLDMELESLLEKDIDMTAFGFDEELTEDTEPEEQEVSFTVKEKHQVIVDCENAEETFKLQSMLQKKGYQCKTKNT